MTARRKEISERIQRDFEACDRHILRINEALGSLGVDLPMSPTVYASLTSDQIRCIDQFIFRFSKLQDALGTKIFRYTLELLDEDVITLPMRDILNRLERYALIPSVDEWTYIRELRNEIAHDYPLGEKDIVSILNELIEKKDVLFSIYITLKDKATEVLYGPALFS